MLQKIFCLNEQGRRKNIEDSLFPLPGKATEEDYVFLVCDGVGGENKGEEASRIAAASVGQALMQYRGQPIDKGVIQNAVLQALEDMKGYAAIHPGAEQMSTTLTLVYFQPGGAWVAWCGDSRVYHLRNGEILWRTKDHSLVQQLIAAGEITEADALRHPKKNIILRSLSANNNRADVDIHFLNDIQPGDYLLLCTDGVLEQIDDERLQAICTDKMEDKKQLFLQYCEGRTNDNFSMYLLQAGGTVHSHGIKKNKNRLLVIIVLILLIAGGYAVSHFAKKKTELKQPLPSALPALPVKKAVDTNTGRLDDAALLPQMPEKKISGKKKKQN